MGVDRLAYSYLEAAQKLGADVKVVYVPNYDWRWGALITNKEYSNYRLVVEFRWGLLTWAQRKTGVRDSGVLVHAQGRDGNSRPDFNRRATSWPST